MSKNPDFILFAQHGWADTHQAIATLAHQLATPNTHIVTPNLGWFKTWLRIEPLIECVEQIAIDTIGHYPQTPIRIIGHSMGGLIWLEILNKHPEWWQKIESFVLVASPVGGADLARLFDPLGVGIGIAGALGMNRRPLAQLIAKTIPTLVIAGDIDGGSDGTITIGTTHISGSTFVCLPRLAHATLKNHPAVVERIREFWANPILPPQSDSDLTLMLIERLQSIPGITDAHWRDFIRAKHYLSFTNGLTLHTWKNSLQLEYVFLGNGEAKCLYGGYVGWMHGAGFRQALQEIKEWAIKDQLILTNSQLII